MNRRQFLNASAALAGGGLFLAACGGPNGTPAAIISDMENALSVMKADVALIPGIAATTVAAVQTYADQGLEVLNSMVPTATGPQAATVLAQAVAYLNAALAALPAVLPPPINMYVAAAAAIALSVERYIAQATATPPVGAPLSVVRRAEGMSVEQARTVLASARRGR